MTETEPKRYVVTIEVVIEEYHYSTLVPSGNLSVDIYAHEGSVEDVPGEVISVKEIK